MKRADFIKGLRKYLIVGDIRWKGQRSFAEFLIEYLMRLDLSYHEQYDFWHIDPYIPQIMLDAFEELRTGTDDWVVGHRKHYEKDAGHPVPNITDIGASNMFHQCSAIQTTLGFMLKEVMEDNYVELRVDAYCNAQDHVIQQYFDKFLREVYCKGLREIIEKSKVRGMEGRFGKTELRAFPLAGRLMFTFARKKGKGEIRASFIMEDGDPQGYSGGLNSYNTNFIQCLDLISDVIRYWPATSKEQRTVFKSNPKVTLDIIAAIRAAKKAEKKRERPKKAVSQ